MNGTQKTSGASALAGRELAITGRLASMGRDEARERIAAAGGSYVEEPRAETAFLVVGQGGAPLGDDGKPTRKLALARELREGGAEIEVVPETRFLVLLGLERRQGELHRLYSTAQLARILEVREGEVRRWVRLGLIRPIRVVKRLAFFDFPQVATARTLSQLTRAGVTPQRIRRSLEELREWLPGARRALLQLEALEDGGALVVRTDDGRLAETSGQLRLEFRDAGAAPPPRPAAPPAPRPPGSSEESATGPSRVPARGPGGLGAPSGGRGEPPQTATELAETWFERGVRAEESERLEDAVHAYRRALAADAELPEAWFNLGNVLYALRRRGDAAESYGRAVELDADYVEAWNNLGIVQGELGRLDEALRSLRRALVIAPDYADAHFNLGETFAASGDVEAARRHWRAYLNMDPTSAWSVKVRERLRRG